MPPQLNKKHFSVATYLGYGVERFHERYIKTVDRDPCAQPADFDGCRSAIASALGIMDCRSQHKQPCALPFDSGEDEAPPEPIKPTPNARFVATSLYFYAWRTLHQALPLLVELGGDEYDTAHAKAAHAALDGMWPAPSVEKAKEAAEAYCSASPALLSKAASEEIAWDAFHGDSARRHRDFPRRCFEAAYVDVLLRDVVGVDPSGRALLVAIKLRGVELDWTLGAVLDADAHALTRTPRHQPHTHGVDGTVPVTKKHGGWRFFLFGFCGIALLLVLAAARRRQRTAAVLENCEGVAADGRPPRVPVQWMAARGPGARVARELRAPVGGAACLTLCSVLAAPQTSPDGVDPTPRVAPSRSLVSHNGHVRARGGVGRREGGHHGAHVLLVQRRRDHGLGEAAIQDELLAVVERRRVGPEPVEAVDHVRVFQETPGRMPVRHGLHPHRLRCHEAGGQPRRRKPGRDRVDANARRGVRHRRGP